MKLSTFFIAISANCTKINFNVYDTYNRKTRLSSLTYITRAFFDSREYQVGERITHPSPPPPASNILAKAISPECSLNCPEPSFARRQFSPIRVYS